MKNLKRLGACSAALGLLVTAGAAQAQTLPSLKVETGATVNATATGNGTNLLQRSATSTSAGNATPNASVNGRANANINSRLNATATNSFNTLNGNSTRTADADTFTITRSDIVSATSTVIDPADVSSADDFAAYARSIMSSDENVVRIDSNGESVSVWYKEPAKFLGIIPVMVNTQATVTSDGTVTITHPWWYNVFVKDSTVADFQRNLSVTAGTIARSEGQIELSSGAQARLVNALHMGMKEHYDANIATGTTTDMTAQ